MNRFDSRHQLAYRGPCPGEILIDCVDDADTKSLTWKNEFNQNELVYFMIDAYSTGHGSYTIEWEIQGNKGETG